MSSKIKAILFDMDGVLVEAKDWHFEALNKVLDLFGMPISKFDHLMTFDGLPTRKKLELLSMEKSLPVQLHEFINQMKQQYTMELIQMHCKPTFIHEYALSNLKALGFRLAVCSNSVRNTVETMMEKANLLGYFDYIISSEDVSKEKPDPEMYNKAIKYFKLKPSECLIVEDNDNGIRAAKASGGNLLIVKNSLETNLENILDSIKKIEGSYSTEVEI
jgi:beta-phosphoglucomutase